MATSSQGAGLSAKGYYSAPLVCLALTMCGCVAVQCEISRNGEVMSASGAVAELKPLLFLPLYKYILCTYGYLVLFSLLIMNCY